MNPWSALLESLHSAFIDELIARYPKQSPELGLPRKNPGWKLPDEFKGEIELGAIELKGKPGVIAFLSEPAEKLSLLMSVYHRAQDEFKRREIAPRLSAQDKAKGAPPVKLVIWIPVRLDSRQYYLGVGVN